MTGVLPPALGQLVAAYHARTPPRTWSLLVTMFGELARGHDEMLSAVDIASWMADIGVEPGLVRTALSRLVANGMVLRSKAGKSAFYRLSERAEAEFAAAADIIYGRNLPRPTGRMILTLIDGCADRVLARTMLDQAGAKPLTPVLMLMAEHKERAIPHPSGALVFHVDADAALIERASALWSLEHLNTGYHALAERAEALLSAAATMSAREALLGRLLIVHHFRRIVLRDPFLPRPLLPEGWAGSRARQAFDAAHAALLIGSAALA